MKWTGEDSRDRHHSGRGGWNNLEGRTGRTLQGPSAKPEQPFPTKPLVISLMAINHIFNEQIKITI